jgi:hypothetical protein
MSLAIMHTQDLAEHLQPAGCIMHDNLQNSADLLSEVDVETAAL